MISKGSVLVGLLLGVQAAAFSLTPQIAVRSPGLACTTTKTKTTTTTTDKTAFLSKHSLWTTLYSTATASKESTATSTTTTTTTTTISKEINATTSTSQKMDTTGTLTASKETNSNLTATDSDKTFANTTTASKDTNISTTTTATTATAKKEFEFDFFEEDWVLPKPPSTKESAKRRVSILVCPAQFCVPDDYNDFFEQLQSDPELSIGTCRVAPLPRNEWIKVAKKLPTLDFLQAKLPVKSTLDWYFDAMETAISEILAAEGPDASICLVTHSIGGWVARAYLGGLSQSSTALHRMANITSLITLGTPHSSPPQAWVDQTRGLLQAVEDTPACSPQALHDRGIQVTCVSSNSMSGKFFTTNVEEFVAAASYTPLTGKLFANLTGDGIVPTDLAFMDPPARKVVLEHCPTTEQPIRHAHVLPKPWNLWNPSSSSIPLPVASYFSKDVVPMWAKYIIR